MGIDSTLAYWPSMQLPVYTKITDPKFNNYTLGETYEIRIEDGDRAEEGPYNYVHDAILIGKWKCKLDEIPDILLALTFYTKSKNEALNNLEISGDNVVVLCFMRNDKVKEFIGKEYETIFPDNFSKEDVEDD